MAMKTLPMLCIILFLIFSVSLVFPSAEGIRTLEESKADGSGYSALKPSGPAVAHGQPGQPYTRPCRGIYNCPGAPPAAKP